jgi:hypothetical protein
LNCEGRLTIATVQALPFHDSTSGVGSPLLGRVAPTDQQESALAQVDPRRTSLTPLGAPGAVTMFHPEERAAEAGRAAIPTADVAAANTTRAAAALRSGLQRR